MASGNGRVNATAQLVAHLNPRSPAAEAYRVLRTNLQYATADRPARTLLVTSAGPEEGKSTTLSNLAVTLAQAQKRVAVIDCDLRKPTLHRIFDLDNGQGLTTVLVGAAAAEEVTQRVDIGQQSGAEGCLHVIPSGPIPPNPAELLDSERMRALLPEIAGRYDHVLVDSPPVVAVADATILASRVDGVLLVVRSRMARNDLLREAKRLLEKANARILGAVLNDVAYSDDEYRYYYYYGRGSPHSVN